MTKDAEQVRTRTYEFRWILTIRQGSRGRDKARGVNAVRHHSPYTQIRAHMYEFQKILMILYGAPGEGQGSEC